LVVQIFSALLKQAIKLRQIVIPACPSGRRACRESFFYPREKGCRTSRHDKPKYYAIKSQVNNNEKGDAEIPSKHTH
jgi:hypothetical protein